MAKTKELGIIVDFLREVEKIPDIEKVEIINIPEEVEADIGLKIFLKKGKNWIDVQHKIHDLVWKIFEKTGEYLLIYKEFDEKK